ncbi:MAG: hypothetical protein FJ117_23045 [Deltaproteobacteria bacterium]|nr:hypothetical protein [Deltaproteobacteria bacterium]
MKKNNFMFSAMILFLSVAVITLFSPGAWAQTRSQVNVPLLAAPFGTGGYALSFATQEISKRHPWLRISAAETPGYVYNVKTINANPAQWKTHILGTSTGTNYLAEKGLPPVNEKISGYRMLVNNEIISSFLVTLDPKIKTLKDLAGKKVALGLITQILWGIEPAEHIRAVGLGGSIGMSHVGPMPAMHALLDGTVAACVSGVNSNPLTGEFRIPPQLIELLATGKKFYYISFGEEAIDKLNATGYPGIKWTLPAGKLQHQTDPLLLNATLYGWAAKESFPEDLAYEITKLHIDRYKDFGSYHALCELFSKEFFAWGFDKKIAHPGAIRAFKEAGITIKD